jgi:lipopolysaccharide export system protein LptC
MNRDRRRIAVVLVLAALTGASWWLSRTARQVEPPPPAAAKHEPDYIVEKMSSVVMRPDGTRRYSLGAARLAHFADDGSAELDEPLLVQYGQGAPLHTRADRGWIPRDGGHIVMTGNVRSAKGRDPGRAGGEMLADRMKIVLDN